METGKVVGGTSQLVFDGVDAISSIVEKMYRNIAATPFPFGQQPDGAAPGIAGLVYQLIREINKVSRGATTAALDPLIASIDRIYPPGPYRDALVAALNGVCGDHLEDSNNHLAIPMRFRVYLQPNESEVAVETGLAAEAPASALAKELPPFAHLFESHRRGVEVYPQTIGQKDPGFVAGDRLLVLIHGLCMSDRGWTASQHNHGHALAEDGGYTPVFAHYNSGRHISVNGRELSEAIEDLVAGWPVAVKSVTVLGFSMGGLVARSALHAAEQSGSQWRGLVDKAVYVGTPHHGAAMERGGFWLQKSATFSPYTAPLAALGKLRSTGITDLRFGNVRDADWEGIDVHEDNVDHRLPTPLPENISHFAIGATLSKTLDGPMSDLRSDGLVQPLSSIGAHGSDSLRLKFDEDKVRLFADIGHLSMLGDSRVYDQLRTWLVD